MSGKAFKIERNKKLKAIKLQEYRDKLESIREEVRKMDNEKDYLMTYSNGEEIVDLGMTWKLALGIDPITNEDKE